ncbi:hypothetical protein NDU88_007436 [Pleurodeles waltl]|uniref:Uncharacterized protein n=1 Tax=Pleurodeles waltl TaxID=8319 RepID=A0AAV7SSH7_PLEWA|nr:hypothetical protein NDU88_007436 [Pleurodeles waltl]
MSPASGDAGQRQTEPVTWASPRVARSRCTNPPSCRRVTCLRGLRGSCLQMALGPCPARSALAPCRL